MHTPERFWFAGQPFYANRYVALRKSEFLLMPGVPKLVAGGQGGPTFPMKLLRKAAPGTEFIMGIN
jgi:hypothetical protein